MEEIKKLYENVGVREKWERYETEDLEGCVNFGSKKVYPPFTAEKQIAIEEVILQNKKNYNKWIEYNINVYGEWVIRFVRTDKFAPYVALGKTRAEAFANVINYFWQDLTEEERKQIKEILK